VFRFNFGAWGSDKDLNMLWYQKWHRSQERNNPSQLTSRTQLKQERTHDQRGSTVVLLDTVWPCELAGCYGKTCSLGTVGIGYVFTVKADSKGIALALIKHGKGCEKG